MSTPSLKDAVMRAIVARWLRGERAVASEDVYDDLSNAGLTIPENAMNTIFEAARQAGQLRGALPLGRDAGKKHGAMVITYVAPSIIQQYQP